MSIFIENKYTRWYYNIISNAQNQLRKKGTEEYYESHHIIPRSLGGSNEKCNLVLLTAKEHFLCHILLSKMCVGNFKYKMFHALWSMCHTEKGYKISSRFYQYIKENRTHSETTRKKISNHRRGKPSSFKGRLHTEESKKKMSESQTGKIRSDEVKKKMAEIKKGSIPWNKDKKHSEETKTKMSNSSSKSRPWQVGRKHSEEAKKKMSKSSNGQIAWNKGKKHSEETRKKMSEAQQKRLTSTSLKHST
jgi:hypothetical protein